VGNPSRFRQLGCSIEIVRGVGTGCTRQNTGASSKMGDEIRNTYRDKRKRTDWRERRVRKQRSRQVLLGKDEKWGPGAR
jgi:hypothetical protein